MVLPEDIDEDVVMKALSDLERARAALVEEDVRSGVIDFGPKIRGGRGHAEATGEGVHATQAVARTDVGYAWAKRRGLQTTFKMTHSVWDPDVSGVLCRCWAHRMQFFCDMEQAAANPAELYQARHIAEYVEPTELTAAAAGAGGKLMQRIEQIRRIPRA